MPQNPCKVIFSRGGDMRGSYYCAEFEEDETGVWHLILAKQADHSKPKVTKKYVLDKCDVCALFSMVKKSHLKMFTHAPRGLMVCDAATSSLSVTYKDRRLLTVSSSRRLPAMCRRQMSAVRDLAEEIAGRGSGEVILE
ncbi:MAG TPA: hypothetical protein O0X39_05150 [Methanocorpusculum sp.]|nr:hypothetical protein [Methanocorpusculum sp.]